MQPSECNEANWMQPTKCNQLNAPPEYKQLNATICIKPTESNQLNATMCKQPGECIQLFSWKMPFSLNKLSYCIGAHLHKLLHKIMLVQLNF